MVFERYYMVFGLTFAEIYNKGHGFGMLSGPRLAAMMLMDTAKGLGIWEGQEGVEQGLVQEMRRLTNVFTVTARGWEPIPFHEAISTGKISERDASEVENALTFFTVSWHMNRWEDRKKATKEKSSMLSNAVEIWGGHLESLSYTEFRASLPTLTGAATSQQTQPHLNSGVHQSQTPPPATAGADLGVIQIPT